MKHITQSISLLLGVICAAAPFPLFFIPNGIAPGGVTGVATLIHSLTGFPAGSAVMMINIPLFFVSFSRIGRHFFVKSIVATALLSLLIDLIPIRAVTADPMLSAIFGGLMMGVGIGLVIRAGASTGGTDMAAALLHQRISFISVGSVLLFLDCIVITASGFVFSPQSAMYALISVFITSQVMDRTVEGLESAKAFFVFSAKSREIASDVLTALQRGATLLRAQGAYSGREGDVLLCVIIRTQIPQFKSIVNRIDPGAFLMVTDVREAMGEGFTKPANN